MLSARHLSSQPLHRLARFVNKQAAALMFNLDENEIYRVERWAHIVYVYGKGVSKFISYADFPPIVGVATPTSQDFVYWRRRWKKRQQAAQKKQAPAFWVQFFAHQFYNAPSVPALYRWGKLIGAIKFAFAEATLQRLREAFSSENARRNAIVLAA